jgi:peptidoglycan/LPS O-acetylase OafA/YrhL
MKEVKMKKPTFFARFITMISIISYSVYIFHKNIVLIIIDRFLPESTLTHFQNLLVFFLYCTLAILFSILIYKYFEHPMTELRERFDRKKS